MALKEVESAVMRDIVLNQGLRADGRGTEDVRPITSRASVLPRTHGSALFTRGETQALCVATLGSASDALKQESLKSTAGVLGADGNNEAGRFYLQYHFPPSSVGETGRTGAPGGCAWLFVPLGVYWMALGMGWYWMALGMGWQSEAAALDLCCWFTFFCVASAVCPNNKVHGSQGSWVH